MKLIEELKFNDGILIIKWVSSLSVTLPMAKQMVKERLDFQQGKDYAMLNYVNGIKFGTSEARVFMNKEGIIGLKAGAFIVNNAVSSMVMNFFLLINKPPIPSKLFPQSKEAEAMVWLQQYK